MGVRSMGREPDGPIYSPEQIFAGIKADLKEKLNVRQEPTVIFVPAGTPAPEGARELRELITISVNEFETIANLLWGIHYRNARRLFEENKAFGIAQEDKFEEPPKIDCKLFVINCSK